MLTGNVIHVPTVNSMAIVQMLYNLFDSLTWRCYLRLGLAANCLMCAVEETHGKGLIVDTDFFSDVE
jgi:hypothetical protein